TPYQQLELIREMVRDLEQASYSLYNDKLLPALAKAKLRILAGESLTVSHQKHLDEYFESEVYPVLTPVAIDASHPFPHLANLSFELDVLLVLEKNGASELRLSIVQHPGTLPAVCVALDGYGLR